MGYLKMLEPTKDQKLLEDIYGQLKEMFGLVPKVFAAMNLRPDLLEPVVVFVKRLMVEDHALQRRDKELIAAYVSKLNACAY